VLHKLVKRKLVEKCRTILVILHNKLWPCGQIPHRIYMVNCLFKWLPSMLVLIEKLLKILLEWLPLNCLSDVSPMASLSFFKKKNMCLVLFEKLCCYIVDKCQPNEIAILWTNATQYMLK
jgi:hypothetical protein